MERFDPANAHGANALLDHARDLLQPQGFGERPIGELIRAIVTRLDQQAIWSPPTG